MTFVDVDGDAVTVKSSKGYVSGRYTTVSIGGDVVGGAGIASGHIYASMKSISIGGGVTESTALTSYGFVGRSIKSLSIAGQKRTLPAPGQSVSIDGSDVRIHVLPISLG